MPKDNSHIVHKTARPGSTECGCYTGSARVRSRGSWDEVTCSRCLRNKPVDLRSALTDEEWHVVEECVAAYADAGDKESAKVLPKLSAALRSKSTKTEEKP